MNLIERRSFLKTSALAAASAAAASRASAGPATIPSTTPDGITWDKAPCRFCGTGCHVKVGVKEGKVVAIAGHPDAEVNKGLLCVKGYHVGGILYGKDRLTQPMLRKNGVLEPISWEEAIDTIAQRIMKNPKGFGFYSSGQSTIPEGYAKVKFMKGGLSNNHTEPNARLCMASAVTGYISTYGVDEPAGCYDDFDVCNVLLMWGNNMAEMHPVLFSRILDRKTRGDDVTIIDLGTRRTRTSEFSDHYLEFRPQTDLAIANCIAQQLISKGAWDKDFIEKHCAFRADIDPAKPDLLGGPISFEEYKKHVAEYTPEHVSQLSGLSVEQLTLLGYLFANPKIRITSTWFMGMNQHTRGTAINRLVHAIHLLSGHFGKPGDAPTSLTGQPSACGTAREVGTLCHTLPGGRLVAKEPHRQQCEAHWNLPAGRINPVPGYHTVQMFEKFCTPTDKGGDIDTIMVQVTNPGHTLPNLKKLYQAKVGLEDKFLIVSDVYPTASTEIADLVLPAALWAPFGIAIDTVFLNPHRGRQHQVGDLGGSGRIDVGNDQELVLQAGFSLIEFFEVRQCLSGVGHLHHDGVDVAALVGRRAEFFKHLDSVVTRRGVDPSGGQVPVFFALLAVWFLRHQAAAGQRVAKRADLAGCAAGGRLSC